jgi:hypothetical protein
MEMWRVEELLREDGFRKWIMPLVCLPNDYAQVSWGKTKTTISEEGARLFVERFSLAPVFIHFFEVCSPRITREKCIGGQRNRKEPFCYVYIL